MSDNSLLSPHGTPSSTPPRQPQQNQNQQQSTPSTATVSASASTTSLNRFPNSVNNSNSNPYTYPNASITSQSQQHQLRTSASASTLPVSSKTGTSTPSRYNPPVPSRMTGQYANTANNNGSFYNQGNLNPASSSNYRRGGTSSAPSSPPGTPPNGLRNYYLNAASKRTSGIYSSASAANSTASFHRPSISIVVASPPSSTSNNSNGAGTSAAASSSTARRSYSADHLAIEEPEITVTTPGGSNSTEEHVMTLQLALSNLIEKKKQGGDTRPRVVGEDTDKDDLEDLDNDGPLEMKPPKAKIGTGKRSSVPAALDAEKAAHAMTHGISGSDISLGGLELSEKEMRLRERKRSQNRLSRLFNREKSAHEQQELELEQRNLRRLADVSRQPSKAGVLSNLLKLQDNARPKHHRSSPPGSKSQKEKKKRPKLYSRSANNSTHSLTAKNLFGTYPPLPVTPIGSTTANGNNTTHWNGTNSHRNSLQIDNGSFFHGMGGANGGVFPPGHSPYASPNGSPRGSFSQDISTLQHADSLMGTLSPEEKMRITLAVADILQRQDYVLRLARAMIKFGAPSHRLEDAVDHTARTLELNLQCVYLPNLMIVAFTDYETHTSETHLLKVSAGLNMYKFAQVHQILKMVTHSSMPVEEAIMKLDAINTEKDVIPLWAVLLSYAVASFCTAPMFFKGGWVDAGVAFLLGGAVGLMTWLSEKVPSYAHICEVTMSVVVAFIAEALHSHVCRSSVKFAGIVILLPGYTITCAILELSSRHMISGSVRLFFAIIFSLLLSYGLTIGANLWLLVDPSSTPSTTGECGTSLDAKWNILFVPLFAISLNVWLKAHPRQWILATILSIVAYSVSFTTSKFAGAKPEVSSALAAFSIGFFGNIYQRLTHQLTFQAVVCAVFFLVPGSIGLKTGVALFTDDMAGGVNLALQMVIAAIAISVGLFASALVVYPMGKARSAQMTF
ncbi:hypothetical protein BGZ94_007934 [Podila epigama]|nr:hypothetical protein BGZ94_007934 [Podila epigama]